MSPRHGRGGCVRAVDGGTAPRDVGVSFIGPSAASVTRWLKFPSVVAL